MSDVDPKRRSRPGILFYVVCSAVLFALFAVIDFIARGEAIGLVSVLWVAGIGLGIGAAHGLSWGAFFILLYGQRKRFFLLFWTAAGLAVAFWLAQDLGVIWRLNGRYHDLAVKVLRLVPQ